MNHSANEPHNEDTHTRMVDCVYLGKRAPGLNAPPLPGKLGMRIYESISAQAWQLWLQRQTMLINEYQMQTHRPEHVEQLIEQTAAFLFRSGHELEPEGYRPSTT